MRARLRKYLTSASLTPVGRPGHSAEDPVSGRLGAFVEILESEDRCDRLGVVDIDERQIGEIVERLAPPAPGRVVGDDQVGELINPLQEVDGLEPDQGSLVTERNGEVVDLGAEPMDDLGSLDDRDNRPIGGGTFDLLTGEDLNRQVEPTPESIEVLHQLIDAGQDGDRALQFVTTLGGEDDGDLASLADRYHRRAGLDRHPFGGAVPGAGFPGRDGGSRG